MKTHRIYSNPDLNSPIESIVVPESPVGTTMIGEGVPTIKLRQEMKLPGFSQHLPGDIGLTYGKEDFKLKELLERCKKEQWLSADFAEEIGKKESDLYSKEITEKRRRRVYPVNNGSIEAVYIQRIKGQDAVFIKYKAGMEEHLSKLLKYKGLMMHKMPTQFENYAFLIHDSSHFFGIASSLDILCSCNLITEEVKKKVIEDEKKFNKPAEDKLSSLDSKMLKESLEKIDGAMKEGKSKIFKGYVLKSIFNGGINSSIRLIENELLEAQDNLTSSSLLYNAVVRISKLADGDMELLSDVYDIAENCIAKCHSMCHNHNSSKEEEQVSSFTYQPQ